MSKIVFGKGKWDYSDVVRAYTYRCPETPDFHQADDHIYADVNKEHHEGFDNISLLTREKYSLGVTATINCSFEDAGCPEIIIVPEIDECEGGFARYGACFEVVLHKNGVNVWRYFREDGKCFWHIRLRMRQPVEGSQMHNLKVNVVENYIEFELDGVKHMLRTEDLPEKFHIGLTVCEGITRIYDFEVDEIKE